MLAIAHLIGVGFLVVSVWMFLVWVVYLIKKKIAIVDLGFEGALILLSLSYLFLAEGDILRRLTMAFMVCVASSRLFYSLAQRLKRTGKDDARYVVMVGKWGHSGKHIKILLMYLFQGFIALILSLPFAIAGSNNLRDWTYLEAIAPLFWFAAFYGEALADKQLKFFKANHLGAVCDLGLWKYSRHPNYFFEWLIWVSYFLFAFSSPFGSLAIVAPLLMLFLLLQVSGIPLTEQELLDTKGEEYRKYQERTSAFLPWFPS